jgi:glutamate--cysteine ligase
MADFTNHLSSVYPDVRLKTFLEMRGADAGPWPMLCAIPALWVGLLYDRQVRGGTATQFSPMYVFNFTILT